MYPQFAISCNLSFIVFSIMLPVLFLYLLTIMPIPEAKELLSCNTYDVHALILARGGSKGVVNKNLAKIDGISLIGKTISIIKNSNCFDNIWVSTDSEAIADEAIRFGALVHNRSKEYAKDETSSVASVNEFLSAHKTIFRFALFQCTSVFLNTNYIIQAFQKFQSSECVFAVKRSHNLRWKLIKGQVIPSNFNLKARPRRQDWSGELIETGMFYFSTRVLVKENQLQNEWCNIVEIKSEDVLEIDTQADLDTARCITTKKYESN